MRAGRLDRQIKIIRDMPSTIDEYGTPIGGPLTAIHSLRASLLEATAEEFIRDFGADTERVTIFKTRFVSDIKTSDLVEYDGRLHDIKELKEIGRRRGLEIRTIERSGE